MTDREEKLKEVYVVQLNDLMESLLNMKKEVLKEKAVEDVLYIEGYIDAVDCLLDHYGETLQELSQESKSAIKH